MTPEAMTDRDVPVYVPDPDNRSMMIVGKLREWDTEYGDALVRLGESFVTIKGAFVRAGFTDVVYPLGDVFLRLDTDAEELTAVMNTLRDPIEGLQQDG